MKYNTEIVVWSIIIATILILIIINVIKNFILGDICEEYDGNKEDTDVDENINTGSVNEERFIKKDFDIKKESTCIDNNGKPVKIYEDKLEEELIKMCEPSLDYNIEKKLEANVANFNNSYDNAKEPKEDNSNKVCVTIRINNIDSNKNRNTKRIGGLNKKKYNEAFINGLKEYSKQVDVDNIENFVEKKDSKESNDKMSKKVIPIKSREKKISCDFVNILPNVSIDNKMTYNKKYVAKLEKYQ